MKLFLKSLLLAGCVTTLLYSMDHKDDLGSNATRKNDKNYESDGKEKGKEAAEEPSADEPARIILPFSQERVEFYKNRLSKSQKTRRNYRMLAGAGVALAGGCALYLAGKSFYDWNWGNKDDGSTVGPDMSGFNAIGKGLTKVSKRVETLETIAGVLLKEASDKSWRGWAWRKVRDVVNTIPGLGANVVYGVLVAESMLIARRFLPALPYITEYLVEDRTLGWYIETQTSLRKSVRDLACWADELVSAEKDNELQCFSASARIFVEQIEKVMGYMLFLKDQLAQEQENEISRAHTSAITIKKLSAGLINQSNKFILGEKKLEGAQRAEFAVFVKKMIRALIHQMENFEVVQEALSYINERPGTFDDLRAELSPTEKKLRAEVKKLRAQVSEIDWPFNALTR